MDGANTDRRSAGIYGYDQVSVQDDVRVKIVITVECNSLRALSF